MIQLWRKAAREGQEKFRRTSSRQRGAAWVGTFDTGLTYSLTGNVELNAGVNIALTRSADDWNPFVGPGLEVLRLRFLILTHQRGGDHAPAMARKLRVGTGSPCISSSNPGTTGFSLKRFQASR